MNLNLLRECIVAEIEYALASREKGSDGQRQSASHERIAAEKAWGQLLKNCKFINDNIGKGKIVTP